MAGGARDATGPTRMAARRTPSADLADSIGTSPAGAGEGADGELALAARTDVGGSGQNGAPSW